jgi:hypothetical protein
MRTKKPVKKRPLSKKLPLSVDPTRLALAALERIKTVLERKGDTHTIGEPATMRELAARARMFDGRPLPPSYASTLRVSTRLGDPDVLLHATEMEQLRRGELGGSGDARPRYVPFCRADGDRLFCFDLHSVGDEEELAVVEWGGAGMIKPTARHFGEWLDSVADAREEEIEKAADIPKSLRDLLVQLGFKFDDPIAGRVHTADVAAVETLIGASRAASVRGEVNRLFDATGKATLTLNLAEFTMAVKLRTGSFTFEAEDVFRWLRTFRDENFFGDGYREPSHPDQVRDLRAAPREPPLIIDGILEEPVLPARHHVFVAASGVSPHDFHVLGRATDPNRPASILLHVIRGDVKSGHTIDEPLRDLHVGSDGALYCLSEQGTVLRLGSSGLRTFVLPRAAGSLTYWAGIGALQDRILVWGTGALLELRGDGFVPFEPDARLERHEVVRKVMPYKQNLAMLVCGDHVGAVARFDGRSWLPVTEEHMVDGDLADVDVFRGVGVVLGTGGEVYRVDGGAPRPVVWDAGQPAFRSEEGFKRPGHAVRVFDGGALVGTLGGVITVGGHEPVFHSAKGSRDPMRLLRIGTEPPPGRSTEASDSTVGIVAVGGPHVWLWRSGAFHVLDMSSW